MPSLTAYCLFNLLPSVYSRNSNCGFQLWNKGKWGQGKKSRRTKYPPGNPTEVPFCLLIANGYTVSSIKIKDITKVLPKVNLMCPDEKEP